MRFAGLFVFSGIIIWFIISCNWLIESKEELQNTISKNERKSISVSFVRKILLSLSLLTLFVVCVLFI